MKFDKDMDVIPTASNGHIPNGNDVPNEEEPNSTSEVEKDIEDEEENELESLK